MDLKRFLYVGVLLALCSCMSPKKVVIYNSVKPFYFQKVVTDKYKGFIEPKGYIPAPPRYWHFDTPQRDVTIDQIREVEDKLNKTIGKFMKENGTDLEKYWRLYRPGINTILVVFHYGSIPDEMDDYFLGGAIGEDFIIRSPRPQTPIYVIYDLNTHKFKINDCDYYINSNYTYSIWDGNKFYGVENLCNTDAFFPKIKNDKYEGFIDLRPYRFYPSEEDILYLYPSKEDELNSYSCEEDVYISPSKEDVYKEQDLPITDLHITNEDIVKAEKLIKKKLSKKLKEGGIDLNNYWRLYSPSGIVNGRKYLTVYFTEGKAPSKLTYVQKHECNMFRAFIKI